ncbi:Ig-like domain-containing protein [Vibrio alginolyticus]|uniref:Ig-like domain-containing protein n=1 Tax=Vibrio alginolyticus TaxID=663 RepID=UPI0027E3CB5D|nr:Ig-like domain-containing protein [Vibrio alginolyticus]WMO18630.1 Ig-like domain-containing protein [Vibrio alginolyticus]
MNKVISVNKNGEAGLGVLDEEGVIYLFYNELGVVNQAGVFDEVNASKNLSDIASFEQVETIKNLIQKDVDPTLVEEISPAAGQALSSSIDRAYTLVFNNVTPPKVSTFFETKPINLLDYVRISDDEVYKSFDLDTTVPGDTDGDGTSDSAPSLSIADAADGRVSAAENSDGVETNVTLPTGVEEGDTVTLTITNPDGIETEQTYTVTAADITNGSASITAPSLTDEGMYSITSRISDAAGNTTAESTPVTFDLDTTVPGDADGDGTSDSAPTLSIADAADGRVSAAENSDGVETNVTLPTGVEEGDTVTLTITNPDGIETEQTYTVTAADITNGSASITAPSLTDEGMYSITSRISDAAGNTTAESTPVTFDLDTTVPGDTDGDGTSDSAPTLSIADAADGRVSAAENSDGVETNVTLPTGVEEGDTVTLTITNPDGIETEQTYIVTQTDVDTGSADITIPSLTDEGMYSITSRISDAAGNTTAESTPVTFDLDTTVPGDTDGDGTSDSAPTLSIADAADGRVSAAENSDGVEANVTLPTGVEEGDTVTLTITNPDGIETEQTYTVTAADITNGSASITAPSLTDEGMYSITSRISDAAGNTTAESTPVTFDLDTTVPGDADGDGTSDSAPTLSIADAADGRVSAAENSDGVETNVTLPTGVEEGDTVTLTITNPDGIETEQTYTVTAADITNGSASITAPSLTDEGMYSITSRISDAAGNTTAESTPVTFDLDTTVPGDTDGDGTSDSAPTLSIADAADGRVSAAENSDGVETNVTLPTGVEEGDTVTLTITNPDGIETEQTYTVTAADITNGSASITAPSLTDEGMYSITSRISDAAGNTTAESTPVTFDLDTTVPGDTDGDGTSDSAPTLSIADAADGRVSAAENSDGVETNVTLPTGVEEGDTVTLTITNPDGIETEQTYIVTQTDVDTGSADITIPSLTDEGMYSITSRISEAAGNTTAESTPVTFDLDTTVPGDTDGDGTSDSAPTLSIADAADGRVSAAENSDGVETNVTLPTGVEEGDTVTLTIANPDGIETEQTYIVTQTDVDTGSADITIPSLTDEGMYSITSRISDAAGNTTAESTPVTFDLDTTVPGDADGDGTSDSAPTLSIADAADGRVSAAENSDGVETNVTLPTGVEEGDTVTLTITNPDGIETEQTYTVTAADITNGSASITAPSLTDEGMYSITSRISDAAGNTTAESTPVTFDLDTTVPGDADGDGTSDSAPTLSIADAADGRVSAAENSDGVETNVTLPTGVEEGDTVTLTITNPDGIETEQTYIVTQTDVDTGSADITIPSLTDEGMYSITSRISDAAGNTTAESTPVTFDLDTTVPGDTDGDGTSDSAPTLSIADAADGRVSAAENSDGVETNVTLPTGVEEGDTVTLTITNPDGIETEQTYIVTQTDVDTGSADITIPSLTDEGMYSITSRISDAAGNTTAESTPVTFDLDTTVPGDTDGDGTSDSAPTLSIADAADGRVSAAENSDGVETNVTLPTGVEEGDTVTLTITNPDGIETEQTYIVTQTDVDTGSADITIPSLTDEGMYSITSRISDAAGNTTAESTPVTFDLDTTVPGDTDGDGTSDSAPTLSIADAADGRVSAAENSDGVETNVTLPTGVEEGDTVTLTIANPDGIETEQTYIVTQTDVDTGSADITIPSLTDEGMYSITSRISDAAGNTTAESTPVTFDLDTTVPGDADGDGTSDSAPTLSIADAADGRVSAAENSDGVETNVTLPTGVEEGDTVTLTITNPDGIETEQTYTVTAADITNGSASITAPSLTDEGMYSITSRISDAAGNTTAESTPVTFDLDTTVPGDADGDGTSDSAPTLSIADAADGRVSAAENSDGVETNVTLPTGVEEGDTVTLTITNPDGIETEQTYIVTQTDVDTGSADITIPSLTDEGMYSITSRISDAAGNTTAESTPVTFDLDTTVPGDTDGDGTSDSAPTLSIADAADGRVSAAENSDGVETNVTLPTGVEEGDTVTLTITNPDGIETEQTYIVTQTDVDTGSADITIPSLTDEGMYSITSRISDAAGNTTAESTPVTFDLDTTVPGDTDGDGTSDSAPTLSIADAADGRVSAAENSDGVETNVTLPTGVEEGDTVTLTITNPDGIETEQTYIVTQTDVDTGSADITIPSLTDEGMYSITSRISEAAGNTTAESTPVTFDLDTTVPGDTDGDGTSDSAPSLSIADAADGRVSAAENSDGVETNVTLPTGVEEGDTVTLTITNPDGIETEQTYIVTQTDVDTGSADITIPSLTDEGMYSITSRISDAAGNTTAESTPVTFDLDTTVPGDADGDGTSDSAPTLSIADAADGRVSAAENSDGVETNVTLPTGVEEGDTVTLTITNPDGIETEQTYTVTAADITNGSASITAPSLTDEGMYSITSRISDAAGNTTAESTPVTFDLDTTVPGDADGDGTSDSAPTLSIADAADGRVSAAENSDGVETNVTLPTGVEEGDTVTLTITNPDGIETEQTYTVTAADITNGSASITAPSLTDEGMYSITSRISDAAGNTTAESTPVTFDLDTTVPGDTDGDGTSDSAPTLSIADAADGRVSAAENSDGVETNVTLPTGVEEGDTVTLTITNPDGIETEQTYTVTAADITNGSASITAPSLTDEGMYSITSRISDAAGNTTAESTPVTFDLDTTVPGDTDGDGTSDSAPTLSIADAADGRVSAAENSDGVETNVTLPTGVEEGDTVTLTITNPDGIETEQTYTVTAADITNGSADITIPSLTDEGMYSITSRISDAAGNTTAESTPVTFDLDTTVPGDTDGDGTSDSAPTLSIADAADGRVSAAENSDGVETNVTLPTGVEEGDTVTLTITNPDGIETEQTYIVTQTDVDTGSADITIPSLTDEGMYSITSRISDAAGNTTAESTPVTFDLDTTVPGDTDGDGTSDSAPTLSIADAADGRVSAAENSDGVETNVTLPTGVEEGDTVTLTITNPDGIETEQTYIVTQTDVDTGSADITIPSLTDEGMYSITSRISEAAGNTTAESTPVTFDLDTTVPGDTDGDGTSDSAPTLSIADAADGRVSAAENSDGVETNVTLPTGVEEGDTVTLTITNPDGIETEQTYIVTQTDVDTGSADITIPSLTNEGMYSITSRISDAAGNTTAESTPVTFDLDTTVPGDADGDGTSDSAPTLSIADAADGRVSAAENSDGVETNVTLPTGVEEGDTVTLTITNPDGIETEQTYTVTAADITNGSASITAPSLTDEGMYSITSRISDAAGNTTAESTPVTFDLDTTVPGDTDGDGTSDSAPSLSIADAADGRVSAAENSDGVETNVTLPTGVEEGDTVTLTITNPDGIETEQTYIVTQTDVDTGSADITIPSLTDEGMYSITSRISDAAGNTTAESTPVTFDLDTTVPGDTDGDGTSDSAPTLSIADAADGRVSAAENSDGVETNVTLPTGVEEGDTVTLTITNPDGIETEQTYTVTAADITNGSASITAPSLTDEGMYSITSRISDAAGNTTAESTPVTFDLDTTVPGDTDGDGTSDSAPTLSIADAADGRVSAAENSDGVEANVTLPTGVEEGDTVTLTITNPDGIETEQTYIVTQTDVDTGSADITIPSLTNEGMYSITSRISDAAGNTTAESTPVTFDLDTTVPGDTDGDGTSDSAPSLSIADAADGRVSAAENSDGVETNVTLPTGVEEGDTVTLTITNPDGIETEQTYTVTAADITNGSASITAPSLTDEGMYSITSRISDAAGNTTAESTPVTFDLDTTVPGDTDGDGTSDSAPSLSIADAADGRVSAAENSDGVETNVTLPTGVEEGDTVTLTITNPDGIETEQTYIVTQTDVDTGSADITIPSLTDEGMYSITSRISDAAGNTTAESTPVTFDLDTTVPGDTDGDGTSDSAPTLSIADAADGRVSAAENSDGVETNVTLPTGVEEGDTVTLTITNPDGIETEQTYTVTAADITNGSASITAPSLTDEGMYSITSRISDAAGNTTAESTPVTFDLDTTVPGDTDGDGTSDSAPTLSIADAADGRVSAAENSDGVETNVTLPTGVEEGDTVTLTITNPDGIETEQTYTVTAADITNGSASITAPSLTDEGMYSITSRISDAAGNTTAESTPVTFDLDTTVPGDADGDGTSDSAPTLSIADAADGRVSAAENSDGVETNVTLPTGVEEGDTVTLTITNPDGIETEQTYIVTQTDVDTGSADITIPSLTDEGMYSITSRISDAAGNTTAESTPVTFDLDTTVPGDTDGDGTSDSAPTLSIADAADGRVSAAENSDGVETNVTLPTGVEEGDTVTLTITNPDGIETEQTYTVTAADITNGSASITAPSLTDEGMYSITSRISDAAGNTTAESTPVTFDLDTTVPGDTDGDGTSDSAPTLSIADAADGRVSAAENSDGVETNVTLPTGVEEGDTVTLTITNPDGIETEQTYIVTQTDVDTGSADITIPSLTDEGMYSITSRISDAAGNTTAESTPVTFDLDTTVPGDTDGDGTSDSAPTLSIADAADGRVSAAENSDGVETNVTLPTGVEEGDTVTLTITNPDGIETEQTYIVTQTDVDTGSADITIPSLTDEGMYSITSRISDAAGNTTAESTPVTFDLDTTVPGDTDGDGTSDSAPSLSIADAADGRVSAAENSDGVETNVTLPTGVEEGDTVTLTITNPDGIETEQTYIVTQTDVDTGSADITIPSLTDEGMYSITSRISDAAGNTTAESTPVTFDLDTTVPGDTDGDGTSDSAPTLSIADAADGRVSAAENSDGVETNVTLPTGVEEGDTVTLTITNPDGIETEQTYIVTQTDVDTGSADITIPSLTDEGMYSITSRISDAAGNTTAESTPVTFDLDTTVPGDTDGDGTSDSAPSLSIADAADGRVSAAENSDGVETNVTLPTGVEEGDTVTLTITNPDGIETEQTYTVTAADITNGSASITAPSLTDEGMYSITSRISDAAGNTTAESTPVTFDLDTTVPGDTDGDGTSDSAPSLSIADAADGRVSAAENSDGVETNVTLPTGVEEGDTVTLTITNPDGIETEQTYIVTQTDVDTGSADITIPSLTDEGMYSITSRISDAAGNTTAESTPVTFDLDTTVPGDTDGDGTSDSAPTLSIADAADGRVSAAENSDGVETNVTLPTGVEEGDTVTLTITNPDGIETEQTYIVTQTDVDTGSADITIPSLTDEGMYSITSRISDAAGNTTAESTPVTFDLDTTVPGDTDGDGTSDSAPTLSIADAADGRVSAAENSDGVETNVTLPTGVEEGDTVTLTITNPDGIETEQTYIVTQTDVDTGSADITIPSLTDEGMYSITSRISDAAGNTTAESTPVTFDLDTTVPGDTDGDGTSDSAPTLSIADAADGRVSAAENSDGVETNVTLPTGVEEGDTVTLTITNPDGIETEQTYTVTAADITNGSASITAPSLTDEGMYSITSRISDAAGNTTAESTPVTFDLDTTVPGDTDGDGTSDSAPTLSIADAADGRVSAAENSDGVETNVTLPTGVEEGDTVTLTITNPDGIETEQTYTVTAADITNGSASITAPSLTDEGMYSITSRISDAAGNTTAESTPVTFDLDTTVPGDADGDGTSDSAPTLSIADAADGRVSAAENSDGVETNVTLPTGVEEGDTVTLTITNPDGIETEQTYIVTQTDVDTGSADITIPSLTDEGMYSITSRISDAAGNTTAESTPVTFDLDTTVPGDTDGDGTSDSAPTLSIADAADGRVSAAENSDGVETNVTLPTGVEEGDTVTLTITNPDGIETEQTYTVTAADITNGSASITAPSLTDEGMYSITSRISDAAGNTTAESTPVTFDLDTTVPGDTDGDGTSDSAPTLSIADAADGRVSAAENSDGVETNVTLPTGVEEGDTVTLTITNPDGIETEQTYIVTQTDVDTGSADITIPSLTDEGMYSITSRISDAAGNTTAESTPVTFDLDTTVPGDTDGDGTSDSAPTLSIADAADGRVSAAENSDGVETNVTLPTGVEEGDTVTLTITNPDGIETEQTYIVTQTDVDTGSADITIPSLTDEGMYSITSRISDAAGNTTAESTPVTFDLDTTVPGDTDGDGTSDSAPSLSIADAADGRVSAAENSDGVETNVTLPTGVEEGDTVTLTITNPDGIETEQTYTVTAADITNGSASITAPSLTDEGMYSITSRISDAAGNTTAESTPVTFDLDTTVPGDTDGDGTSDSAPSLSIADAADGRVSAAENSDGVETNVTLPTGVEEGDTVTLTITNPDGIETEQTYIVTQTDVDTGSADITIPSLTDEGMYSITSRISDAAGNTTAESTPVTFDLDTTVPGDTDGDGTSDSAPTLSIADAADGRVSAAENSDGVETNVTLPTGVEEGDTVTLTITNPDGIETEQTYIVTQTDVDTGSADITIPSLTDEGMYSITSRISDAAGNTTAESTPVTFDLDTTVPGDTDGDGTSDSAPTLSIADAADGRVSAAENSDGVETNVTLPTGVEEGDTVTLTITNPDGIETEQTYIVTQTDVDTGSADITIPSLTDEGMYSITSRISDAAGNTTAESTPVTFDLDTTVPGDTDGDGTSDSAPSLSIADAADGRVSAAENSDGVETNVTLPTGVEEGDTVTLTITNPDGIETEQTYTVTAADITNGSASITAPSLTDEGMYSITSRISDAAGNTTAESTPVTFDLDTTVPGDTDGDGTSDSAPTLSIADAADGRVSAAENSDGVETNVTLPTGVEEGDTVTLTITNPDGIETEQTYTVTAADITNGSASITAPSLTDEGMYSITSRISDAAGNTTAESTPVTFDLDTTVPGDTDGDGTSDSAPTLSIADAADGRVSAAENSDGVETNVTLPTGVEEGDTVTLTITNPDGIETEQTYIVTQTDVDTGSADITIPSLTDEGMYSITSRISDAAGNTTAESTPVTFDLDTTVPGDTDGDGTSDSAPTLSIADAADGRVSAAENSDGVETNVTLPTGVEEGDTVTLTITNPDGIETEQTYTVTAADITNGSADITIPSLTDEGMYSITSRISDAAGNTTAESTPVTFDLDTIPPSQTINIIKAIDNVGSNTGDLSSGDTTDDTSPVLIGSLSHALNTNELVRVFDGNEFIGDAVVAPDGINWEFSDTRSLVIGAKPTYTAFVVDNAGNIGSSSNTFELMITLDAPIIEMNDASDGELTYAENNNGLETSVELPSGLLAGDTINILITNPDGSVSEYSYLITSGDIDLGAKNILLPSLSIEGTYSVSSKFITESGVESSLSNIITFSAGPFPSSEENVTNVLVLHGGREL